MEATLTGTCYIERMNARRTPSSLFSLRSFVPGATLASLVVLLSCGGSDGGSSGASGPVARFHLPATGVPNFLDVPFPSDVYLSNGKIGELPGLDTIFVHNQEFLTHELSKMNGFSRAAMSVFYIDDASLPPTDEGDVAAAAIDPASLPATEKDCVADGSSVFLLDLDATDPAKARVACRAQNHVEAGLSKARPLVGVGPARGVILDEGHRYAAVLTSRIKDKSGKHVAASAELTSVKLDVYTKAMDQAKTLLAPALLGDKSEIVAIAPFTTQNMTHELFDLRSAIEDDPVPALKWDDASLAPMGSARFAQKDGQGTLPPGFTASLDDWLGVVDAKNKETDGTDDPDALLPVRAHDQIAAVGTAVFDAENFLQDLGDFNTLDHATFKYDASGKILRSPQKPTVKIWVTFAVPKTPMPPGGYPAVIVQHGLSGSRQYLFDLAQVVCKKGWMAVAIDSVTFGARAPEPKYQVDQHTDYESAPGATYKGPDGIADADSTGNRNGSFDFFGGLKNIGGLRDQLRQAALDTAQLSRVLRSNPDLGPLKTAADAPKIDPDRIAYIGDSLGGIEGALAAAIEPGIKLWTLNVAGGGLILELASHAPTISLQLNAAAGLNFGLSSPKLNESHPMISIVQTITDPGDPLNYAGDLVLHPGNVKGVSVGPRNILQIEVIFDELVANEANEALARAGGYGLATPNVGANGGVLDLANLDANPQRTILPDVAPQADGTIHDTPVQGVTAVVVQTSPSQHGYDMVRSKAKRSWEIPYADYSKPNPFTSIDSDKQFEIRTSFREIQSTITQFIDDGFSGKVPRVSGFKPPVRDMDDDGSPDATDPNPSDPSVK